MEITRKSPYSGKVTTKEIDITGDQLRRFNDGEELIQNIFPNLSAEDREFILSGYTKEDWDNMFPEEDYTSN